MAEQWLTYQQAGEALGMSPEAARQRARRLKWRTQRGNDGKTLILVPDDAVVQPRVRPSVQTPGQTGDDNALAGLLREQIERESSRADEAETIAAQYAAELVRQAERVGRAEVEAATVREALAREIRRAEEAEEARKVAETQRGAAQASRDATQVELAAWTAGGPLARAWRGFWRGRT